MKASEKAEIEHLPRGGGARQPGLVIAKPRLARLLADSVAFDGDGDGGEGIIRRSEDPRRLAIVIRHLGSGGIAVERIGALMKRASMTKTIQKNVRRLQVGEDLDRYEGGRSSRAAAWGWSIVLITAIGR